MYTDYEVTSNNGNYRKFVPWFKDFVDGFEIVDKLKLPEGIAFAHKFKGVVISVYTYLNYLVQQNKEIGNVIKRIPQIHHIEDARKFHSSGKKADYVINAAGLNASKIRVLKIKFNFLCGPSFACQNNAKIQLGVEGFPGLPNEMLYMMPRKEGGTIIGGCF